MPLIPCQRAAFDIPSEVAYLNCAYMSPLPNRAVAAGEAAIASKSRPWGTFPRDFFTYPDAARALFARIVGADAEGVAIVPSVSYAMAAATKNLPVEAGQEIVTLKDQFPSNVYPWRKLGEENDASIRMLSASDNGPGWTELLLDAISDQTAIVGIPNCHWTNGALIDLEQVSKKCRAHGAALVLDLTQSVGALPISLSAIEPDFAVAASYKWLLGPYAIGFMWVHPKWRTGTPVEEGWIVREGAEDFARLVDYKHAYEPGARRFDMGERSQFQLLPMAAASMEQLLEWGIENIAETLTTRTETIADAASTLGFRALPVGERAGHYLGLMRPEGLPEGLVQKLVTQDIYVSVRGSSVRVTPHLYTSDEDVERFIEALAAEVS